jgi:translation initiation factor IF-2
MTAPLLNAPMVSGVAALPADRAPQRPQPPRPRAPGGAQAVALDCDGGRGASEAGLGLRQDLAAPLGFTPPLAAVLAAPRAPRRGKVPQHDRRPPRVWPRAAGAEAAHDSPPLRDAPIGPRLRARLPATGAPWASHAPLSRCEHRVARRARSRMARGGLEPCLASYALPPRSSCSLAMPPRTAALAHRTRPATLAMRAALASWRATGLRGAQDACGRRASRPNAFPARRGARGGRGWASGGGAPGLRPWGGGAGGGRAGPGGRGVPWAPGHPLPLDALPSRDGGALAPGGEPGRGGRPRRPPPRVVGTALEQARPQGPYQTSSGARGPAENASQAPPRSVQAGRTACQRLAAHPWRVVLPAATAGGLAT